MNRAYALIAVVTLSTSLTWAAENVPINLISWGSSESTIRFMRSSAKVDFFPLSNHFEGQVNKLFCGVASSAIVLNSLSLGEEGVPHDESSIGLEEREYLPRKGKFSPFFKKFTQANIFNQKSKSKLEVLGKPILINGKKSPDYGLQLRQLAQLLRSNGAVVEVRALDDKLSQEKVKSELISNLQKPEDYVLVNYSRKELGQPGGGHISPVGAYDETTDSFLVMDVNPNKAPWVWVAADDLIRAMKTFDTLENRGYLLVSKK